MKRVKRFLITVAASAMLITAMTGCGATNPTGQYAGTAGSYLVLSKDGTAVYGEDDSTGAGAGTWTYENNVITVTVSNLNYPIYGTYDADAKGVLMTAKSSHWNDEYFTLISE